MAKILAENFKAWINKQPPNNDLHVRGTVEVNTGGWSGALSKASTPGINPMILILDLALNKPTGMVTEVISTIEVTFTESPTQVQYESVTVRNGSDEITMSVNIVH